jgi:hypothetical protein
MTQKRNQLALGELAILIFIIIVIGLVSTIHAQSVKADTEKHVTFTYAPPDGTKFIQTVEKNRETLLGDLGRRVDRSKSRTSLVIRQVETGYAVTATPLSMTMTRNGAPVSSPASDVMKDVVTTYYVGQDGRIGRIEGFGGLKEKIQETFPPKVAAALAPVFDEQAMVTRATAEWNAEIGDYVGASFAIGEARTGVVPFELPNGETISFYNHISFPAWEPCPTGSCVRVEVTYNSNARSLGKTLSSITTQMLEKLEKDNPIAALSDAKMSGTASWLIDPTTMLFYAQTMSRTMNMMMNVPGRGAIPATIREDRHYSFEYK